MDLIISLIKQARFSFLLIIISINLTSAQITPGIKFQNGYSWMQIKAKAKKEKKYIFVDAFTTWCAPCRVMATEIFPQQKVADFFNKNFISVSVQMDISKKDDKETKRWYNDAKYIGRNYNIDTYPTYLFFSPNGDLVHKIIGSSTNADEFISKSKLALDPKSQYNVLKQEYQAGTRDADFLLRLINVAQLANDERSLPIYVNAYLSKQKNLQTTQNLEFIASATTKTTDLGFKILLTNPQIIDKIAGKGKSEDVITTILFDEIVLPEIRTGGSKTNYGGGMIVYSGEIVKNVDWNAIQQKLDSKYPNYSRATILASKAKYYEWLKDWLMFTESVSLYISGFENEISYDKINLYAYTVLANCDDVQCVTAASEWSHKTVLDKTLVKPYYYYTYSNLLYKSGKKEEAKLFLENIINNFEKSNQDLISLLNNMKDNKKTWE